MNSDFIVITFDCEARAKIVFDALQVMRKKPLLGLENAIMVNKDNAGRISLLLKRELSVDPRMKGDMLLYHLADLIFGAASFQTEAALARFGIDESFRENVNRTMGINSSALLFIVGYDGLGDTIELLNALSLFRGKIHHTTLPPIARVKIKKNASPVNINAIQI